MATHTDLVAVWFIVSPQSPFKVNQELLPEAERYNLVKLAIADNERLQALDVEFNLPRPSYTINTLDVLRELYPDHHFVLLMGEDNLSGIPSWKQADRILNENAIYVYPRAGEVAPTNIPSTVSIIKAPLLDISATFIRDCVRRGKSIRYLVPDIVEKEVARKMYWR